ncbi:hypothetical protein HOE22_07810 [Candidatus Woesearchaeota archaeon]|jgi:hypothetical protein|nr:hypothetical protein [Candidatus Woesearchaeota archaeon]MBT4733067.1 hypothetical protein [Candidatus Woesearchaeota archaeon]
MRIKQTIKRFLPGKLFDLIREAVYPEKINIIEDRLNSLFLTYYQNMASSDLNQKTALKNAEFKVYSKHGGDGLLLYIFSKIGISNRIFVEMGVEDGRECNTANLSLNFGWNGLLIDANKEWMESANLYYKTKLGNESVKTATCFVAVNNINKLLLDNNFVGEVDLLSIDIDSNDYWILDSITAVNPRVIVMEYNAAFGLNSVTIKHNPDFHYQETYKKNPLYFGASLKALVKLAKKKGYILVGCDTHGHDAFFVRSDVAKDKFVELSPEEAFYPNPYTLAKFGSVEKQFDQVKHLDLVEI